MKAAVLYSVDHPPRFENFPEPVPVDNEVLVHVTAAALHPSTRLLATGRHYLSPQQLPVVCGVDGVGRLDDGTRVFFGVRRPPNGSMSERTAVLRALCWPLPEGVSDEVAAALPNPGLSSWLPLVATAQLQPGETVLVHGATGVAGQLAIQIAKHLGAGRVIAAGRNADQLGKLQRLGADAVIDLKTQETELVESYSLAAGSGGIDVVLDYLWGAPTEVLLRSLVRKGFPTARAGTRFIQIGESAGPVISLPATTLRGAAITITGSGTMPSRELLSEAFSQLLDLAAHNKIRIDVETVPLNEIEEAWVQVDTHGRRLVIVA